MSEVIKEKYTGKYPTGVCIALRNIMGDTKFVAEFGGTTPEEALRKCIESGRDNAARQIDKWLNVWPAKMASFFKLL